MLQFRFFGFPVHVHWFFWLTCIVLGGGFYAKSAEQWLGVAIWTAVVFISIMAHELGHAIASRAYGAQSSIALHGLGGVTMMRGVQFSRMQSILVTLAGPLTGLAIGIVILVASPFLPLTAPLAKLAFSYLIYVNIFWSVLNLLPILPMDGGQIFRDVLGPKHLNIALWTGAILGAGLAVLAFMMGQWFIALLFGYLAFSNFKNRPMEGGVVRG